MVQIYGSEVPNKHLFRRIGFFGLKCCRTFQVAA